MRSSQGHGIRPHRFPVPGLRGRLMRELLVDGIEDHRALARGQGSQVIVGGR
jgi:hypothetical protein